METFEKYLTLKEIREIEQKAKSLGLSELNLIENASSNLANTIEALKLGKKALIVAGRGNNGADALCCARKLHAKGYDVCIALIAQKPLGPQAQAQKEFLVKLKVPLYEIKEDSLGTLQALLGNADFILDGILGIGLQGPLDELVRKTIILINTSKKKIVACDVPSGLSADEGSVQNAAICADYTVTFIAKKKGFLTDLGKKLCGEIIVVDIGI